MRKRVLFFIYFSLVVVNAVLAVGSAGWNPVFPRALFLPTPKAPPLLQPRPLTATDAIREREMQIGDLQSILLNNDVVALYGKPNAETMGLLGQYPLKKIDPIMKKFVDLYDDANGARGIVPAFYIIYGTCWPEGEIGILSKRITEQYIKYAAKRGWYVFLDHQIGKYSVEGALRKLLPFLKYPNVHLALDPEWRTLKPMKEIGSVTAEELNNAQKIMDEYIIEHNLPGRRMLVVHQFNAKMIIRRSKVNTAHKRVQFVHCSDGFGPPNLKRDTYKYNGLAKNIPLKSFKLFLKPKVRGAG